MRSSAAPPCDRFARPTVSPDCRSRRRPLEFASSRHAGQYREIDHAALIAHPIEVGQLLVRDGQPDEVIAAGLLHDVLEKTPTTSPELQRRFGPRIARLVESVSDDRLIGDRGTQARAA
jgi:(p)ppGpp synthase/HD superfamily hydrolase